MRIASVVLRLRSENCDRFCFICYTTNEKEAWLVQAPSESQFLHDETKPSEVSPFARPCIDRSAACH